MPVDVTGDLTPAVAHVDLDHDAHSPHVAHGTGSDMHEHADMPDCAHCPPQADDGESTPAMCPSDGTSNASAPKASGTPDFFKLLTQSRLPTLSWTAAPPPPILAVRGTDAPRVSHTPLNVRHCVFLI
jgi:hypothetical protein